MMMDARLIAEMDQATAQMASSAWTVFASYRQVGFSDDQAMRLLELVLHHMLERWGVMGETS
jgi:uncharacterized membrane protein